MQCPDCGGAMYDNRETKRSPKQPDFKCKDKDGCGKAVWVKKKEDSRAASNGATVSGRALGPLYNECLVFAKAALQHHFGKDVAVMDILAGTATLFSQAAATGGVVRKAKEKPKPAPPPPPPPQEPEDDYDNDADLPF